MLRFLVKRAVASDLWRYKMDGCNYEHCLIHAIGKVRHFQYAVVFICTVVLWMRNINNVLNALCALLSVELEMSEWVQFKLCMTVRRCMQDKAPQYLKEYCISFSDSDGRQCLCSVSRHLLSVPRHRRTFLSVYEIVLNCCDSRAARRMNTWVISWRRRRTSETQQSITSRLGSMATRAIQTLVTDVIFYIELFSGPDLSRLSVSAVV